MIEFVDIAVMTFLRNAFPANFTLVWAPPQISRQALSALAIQQQQKTPTNDPNVTTIGIPGLSVYRTMSNRMTEGFNVPEARTGRQFSQNPTVGDVAGNFNFVKTIPMKVNYTISVWTKYQSDLNDADRILAFMDIAKHVTCDVTDAANPPNTNTFQFPILWKGDPIPAFDVNKNTAKIEYYGLTKDLRIDSVWALSDQIHPIQSIQVLYKQLTSGFPIINPTLVELDDLTTLGEVNISESDIDIS